MGHQSDFLLLARQKVGVHQVPDCPETEEFRGGEDAGLTN